MCPHRFFLMYLINKDETEHTGQVRAAPLALIYLIRRQLITETSVGFHAQHFNPLVLHKSSRRKKQRVGSR